MIETKQYQSTDEIRFYVNMLLAHHCMPALMKIKPSNLITIHRNKGKDEEKFLTILEEEIHQFDCCYYPLYGNNEIYLLLIYDKERLEKVLRLTKSRDFLISHGYQLGNPLVESILFQLQEKYSSYQQKRTGFPHELGIILGYPPEDVEDFIKNRGKNYLLSGAWKVYNNREGAKLIFELYHRVREEAIGMIQSGKKLSEMKEFYNSCITKNIIN